MASLDAERVKQSVDALWEASVIPTLQEYIKVPNLSPFFDKECLTNGLIDKAMALLEGWVSKHAVEGMKHEVFRLEGRTPLMFIEVPSTSEDPDGAGSVLLYGHMDKQPPFEGWLPGLGPYTPVIRDGKLYGRGGADDGYAVFACLAAIRAMREQKVPHARLCIIVEACEESGSPDLPAYIDLLSARIATPSLVVCLDSGSGNYEQLFSTSSLRGTCVGTLTVEVLTEGVHSGDASGVVPDSFRIMRQLLGRVEDAATGRVLLPELWQEPDEKRREQVAAAANVLGEEAFITCFPLVDGCQHVAVPEGSDKLAELALNRWWRPVISYIGADGFPPCSSAGNVLRPKTSLTLSCRLPPTLDVDIARAAFRKALTSDPPLGARVTWDNKKAGSGWAAPPVAPWLEAAADNASRAYYGKPCIHMGEGGSIPFMGMLGRKFPEAQFLITGVLGPQSNAHGPNEFLHIQYSARIACCVAGVLQDHERARVASAAPAAKRARADAAELTAEFGRQPDGSKI